MSPEQVKRWEKTRRMGRTHFVWLFGVLGFGLTMGVCLPVAIAAVGSYLPGNIVPGWERLPYSLSVCLILSPLVGYFAGLTMWQVTESQYARATQLERTEQVLDRAENLLDQLEKVGPRE
jgi:hypothetical protein